MNYRSEIDGLRALAVFPVVLFHAGFPLFSGGFVGVDVFFVISGFLISSIILSELDEMNFSLLNFYERRARRILPALLVVAVCCIPVAWLVLLPKETFDFAESLLAVATFSSNFLFMTESGYFETAAEMKPLLHTWSLAVEEQFYILFPLLLIYLVRFDRRFSIGLLVLVFAFSFVLAELASHNQPAVGFYMLHTRAWELLMGFFAAVYLRHYGAFKSSAASEGLAILGLLAILFGVFCFDATTAFPGRYALLPTLGTVLIILFAVPGTLIQRILSLRWIVGLGVVSYSFYLWHQPIFAFYKASFPTIGKDILVYSGLILLSLGLAVVTYRYIEQPFRRPNGFTRKGILTMAAVAMTFVATAGLVGKNALGFPSRYSDEELAVLRVQDYRSTFAEYGYGTCFIDYGQFVQKLLENNCVSSEPSRPRFIVFGDSEAAHLMIGVREQFADDYEIAQWTGASCAPIVFASTKTRCAEFYQVFAEQFVPGLADREVLVVAGNWAKRYKANPESFEASLREGFQALASSNATIVILGDLPNFDVTAPDVVVSGGHLFSRRVLLQAKEGTAFGVSNQIVNRLSDEFGFAFVDPAVPFCEPSDELNCLIYENGELLFADYNHLSHLGSSRVGALIRAVLP